MFTLTWILAAGVTIQLGNQIWSFGLNVLVYLIVAAIVGFVAEAGICHWASSARLSPPCLAPGYSPGSWSSMGLVSCTSLASRYCAPWWGRSFSSGSGIS